MSDLIVLDDPAAALHLARLSQATRDLIHDRARLASEIEEHGTLSFGIDYLGGRPLLRRRDSLTHSSWFILELDWLWYVSVGGHPTNIDTERGPARAHRAHRTLQFDSSLEFLLGRLYRLQAECDSAGILWADLVAGSAAA